MRSVPKGERHVLCDCGFVGIGLCRMLVAETSAEEGSYRNVRCGAGCRDFSFLDFDEKPCEWGSDCHSPAQHIFVYCVDVGIVYLSLESTPSQPVKDAFG